MAGTCVDIFDGCDEVADFDFTDESTARAAAQALVDQVFIDTAEGSFDTNPYLTYTC